MIKLSKLILTLCLTSIMSVSYALTVSVESNAEKLDGLGFTANGAKHGGMGNSYKASDMPKGMYTFGVRSHGKDVSCYDKSGKKSIRITHDTNAYLSFNGRRCTMKVGS